MTAYVTATGVQGHSAYPHRAKNPMSALVRFLAALEAAPLDDGTDHFDASTLAITTIDCGNPANNVIPAKGRATVNIRFNDAAQAPRLPHGCRPMPQPCSRKTGVTMDLQISISGESFLTPPGGFPP